MKELRTVKKVIDALGRDRLAAITGASTNSITNWLERGQFPAHFYALMREDLAVIGCSAPPRLWGQRAAIKLPGITHRQPRRAEAVA